MCSFACRLRCQLLACTFFALFASSSFSTGDFSNSVQAESPQEWVSNHIDKILDLYQDFHQNPELSFQETNTAAKLAKLWRDAGFEVTEKIGGTGVVAVLRNGPGKKLMLRTDMDALPVVERTNLAYASTKRVQRKDGAKNGVMHACGHDVHMANLVAVGQYMATHRDKWSGTLILIGQPAEERGAGAKAMLEDGLFERFPRPDIALALHCSADLATGKIAYRVGYALANVDSVDITIRGKGGHGAYPHTTIDPVVIAARLILDLQTIVSREIKPTDPAVITVGSIHGGTKHNIIDSQCHLQLTVRSYSDAVRAQLKEAITRKAKASAESAGAPEPVVEYSEGTPALLNDRDLAQQAVRLLKSKLGRENIISSEPSMGGEDFSRYGRAGVPIFMFWLGTVDPQRLAGYERVGQTPPSLHSPMFYPDAEKTLKTGITAMSHCALGLLAIEK